MSRKLIAALAALAIFITILVGVVSCSGGGHSYTACAAEAPVLISPPIILTRGGGGGGGGGGHASGGGHSAPSNSGAHAGNAHVGGSHSAPSNSGAKSGTGVGSHLAPSNSGARPSGVAPRPGTVSAFSSGGRSFPGTYGHSYSYSGHTYIYFPAAHFAQFGYHDPFNPYDPWNYYVITSPFYHHALAYQAC